MFKVLFNESDNFMMISAQWAYDIVQEFVYQFQSFCQNRSVNSRVESDTSGARSDPWSLPIVANTLRRVIAKSTGENATPTPANIHSMMAYFCRVELARMECLLSDYSGSMDAIASINLHDPSEFFTSVPVCHVNVFYHAAVSMLMTRRYGDAIDTLSGVILHISRLLKPGSSTLKAAVLTQHQKMMDKILLLCAIAITICPEHRADGQVVEMVVAKCSDKLKRLQSGDVGAFEDAFESACPKFISPTFSDFGGGFDAWRAQVHVFMGEAKQHIALMKVRSYLRLYSCIDLEKLSRFNDVSQEELVAKLLALSHKCRSSRSDVSYYIEDGKLFTDGDAASAMASVSTRYFFVSNIQKTADHRADLNSIFRDFEAC
ncbi:unnamed protein product [Symbiodinium microadriaticum]|nr:unnamed protein product [Symbiodinium microadriaticum]